MGDRWKSLVCRPTSMKMEAARDGRNIISRDLSKDEVPSKAHSLQPDRGFLSDQSKVEDVRLREEVRRITVSWQGTSKGHSGLYYMEDIKMKPVRIR